MLSPLRRLTLLIIPEDGGSTYEFKVLRAVFWLAGFAALCVVVLLGLGFQAYTDADYLRDRVERLERENSVLAEEMALVRDLERALKRLEARNRQVTEILSGSHETPEEGRGQGFDLYISAISRLRWGRLSTVPILWPVRGEVVAKASAQEQPGILIAAKKGSLIRASAGGKVSRVGFEEALGHVIVIDHGNGVSSSYGRAASVLVEQGRYVHKGQPIGLCGRSSADGQEVLRFSVVENGGYRDPLSYRLWL